MKTAVIQAGGRGTRLAPYTTVIPKPLMPVGGVAIIEVILRQLRAEGFLKVAITVGHLGRLIEALCGNGSRWGLNISYLYEEEPRGTLGSLSALEGIEESFLVINGDTLTDMSYASLLDEHERSGAVVSVAACTRSYPIPFGVFDLDCEGNVRAFREKPALSVTCSMGIYAFQPCIMEHIPTCGEFGFDHLMRVVLERQLPLHLFHFGGMWLDIGNIEDYQAACEVIGEPRLFLSQ